MNENINENFIRLRTKVHALQREINQLTKDIYNIHLEIKSINKKLKQDTQYINYPNSASFINEKRSNSPIHLDMPLSSSNTLINVCELDKQNVKNNKKCCGIS